MAAYTQLQSATPLFSYAASPDVRILTGYELTFPETIAILRLLFGMADVPVGRLEEQAMQRKAKLKALRSKKGEQENVSLCVLQIRKTCHDSICCSLLNVDQRQSDK